MFLGCLAHNSLPVRRNVARRGVKLDSKGPVCQRFGEDCGHVFFKCKYVKLCWHELDMEDIRTELPNRQSGKEIITIH